VIRRAISEIRAVGLRDWLWFVVWLRRDEFSRRLRLVHNYPNLKELCSDRRRAKVIAEKLEQIDGGGVP